VARRKENRKNQRETSYGALAMALVTLTAKKKSSGFVVYVSALATEWSG
jgi:hypothetical protein